MNGRGYEPLGLSEVGGAQGRHTAVGFQPVHDTWANLLIPLPTITCCHGAKHRMFRMQQNYKQIARCIPILPARIWFLGVVSLPTRAAKLQGHIASNMACNIRGVIPPHLGSKPPGYLACHSGSKLLGTLTDHLGSKLPGSLPCNITSNNPSNIARKIGGVSPKLLGNLPEDSGTKFSRHRHTTSQRSEEL